MQERRMRPKGKHLAIPEEEAEGDTVSHRSGAKIVEAALELPPL